jgi:NAD(P)H-nitrite reductase large subunit
MKHLIIGNGPAGVIAAETVRKNAPDDDILLVGSEPEPPYSRMAIPYLLIGDIQESGTHLRKDSDHFAKLRIEQKLGRVRRIDSEARKVFTEDGGMLDFDRLLIASGSSPFVPFIPGIDAPGVHTCWTLNDARKIMQLARPRARVLLMGAGFIGCILMEALAARGVRLTVIEKRDRMVPDMLGEGAGRMIKQWCEKKNIRVHTSSRITAIEAGMRQGAAPPKAPLTARLSGGETLQADLIVCATGVKPNIGFLRDSGIKCSQGILVDASMQTNVPGIYAAGDCAEAFDAVSGRNVISGVQPNAADQAYCAALNMTGRHAFQRGVRQIDVLDTLGLISTSFGQWRGVSGGQWVEFSDDRNFKYLRLEFNKDVLVGSNSIGLTEHASVLRDLIQHRIELGEWKDKLLQDPTRLKEAYSACAQQRYARQAAMVKAAGMPH